MVQEGLMEDLSIVGAGESGAAEKKGFGPEVCMKSMKSSC